ncbi:MAG: glycosyltransferase family 2 protein [Anaerolineales bacterium]|nr:glycosyltransferase family 2 protein [Anaerolineales bacterium]
MDLSIIIVNWNTRDLLAGCLDSLRAHPLEGASETWVVDNASADGSAALVRERYPEARLIENSRNLGFAAANNQALRASTGRYAVLFNSDALARPGALTTMLRFLDAHPAVGAVGPKLVNPDGSFQASYAKFPTLLSELALLTGLARWWLGPYAPSPRPTPGETPRVVDWVAGAALMVRRTAIERVGLMDEGYFLYSEETDWCWRLTRGGFPIWYLPEVEIVHQGGASSRQQSARSYGWLYAGKLRFFARHYSAPAAWALRLAFLAGAAARLALWRALLLLPARAERRPRWRLRAEQDQILLRTCLSPSA